MEEEERQRPTSLQSAKVCFEPMTVELSKFSRADGRRECYLPTGDPARAVQKVPLPSSHEQTKLGSTSLTKPFAQKADFVFEPIIPEIWHSSPGSSRVSACGHPPTQTDVIVLARTTQESTTCSKIDPLGR